MAVRYAGTKPESWLRALGIAAIVGTILTVNATPHGGRISDLGFWAIFRFFLIPFCVASFSAFSKDHAFFLIFPINLKDTATTIGLIALFCAVVWLAKKAHPISPLKSSIPPDEELH